MALKKPAKELVAFLEDHGYVYDRVNTKNCMIYVRGSEEFSVQPGMADHTAKTLIRNLQKRFGETTDRRRAKRDTAQIKDRAARERERLAREIERKDAEIQAWIEEQENREGRLGFTVAEWRLLSPVIERMWRERMEIEALMAGGEDRSRRVRHVAGEVRDAHR